MPDFEDMTGWREELEAWRLTDGYKKNEEWYYSVCEDLVPVSYLIELVDLLLRNDECLKAYKEFEAWESEKLRTKDNNRDDYPRFALSTLSEFKNWYLFKKSLRPNQPAYRRAMDLAELIRNGEFPAAQSSGAIEYLKQKHGDRFIDFER